MWHPLTETVGTVGSESGTIVLDEEHEEGARITLERDGRFAPWAITCGIYGTFLHTAFASTEAEGRSKYAAMKESLVSIMTEDDPEKRFERMHKFAESF